MRSVSTETSRPIRVVVTSLRSGRDILRTRFPAASLGEGRGVKVGVLDTGIGPHPDLRVKAGHNVILSEQPSMWDTNGVSHGTHVAGIIGSRSSNLLRRGLAPGVTLCSYRVFAQGSEATDSIAIADGIQAAIKAKCDLINLSLTLDDPDGYSTVGFMIRDAWEAGAVVIAAGGNFGRTSPVSLPAADPRVIAVSALGRNDATPADLAGSVWSCAPCGQDENDYVAEFCNSGAELDCTAPGVGIVSTVIGGYADMDGTSMAAPCVTAMAARLLANSSLLNAPRDGTRAEGIRKLVLSAAGSLGFPASLEGSGLVVA